MRNTKKRPPIPFMPLRHQVKMISSYKDETLIVTSLTFLWLTFEEFDRLFYLPLNQNLEEIKELSGKGIKQIICSQRDDNHILLESGECFNWIKDSEMKKIEISSKIQKLAGDNSFAALTGNNSLKLLNFKMMDYIYGARPPKQGHIQRNLITLLEKFLCPLLLLLFILLVEKILFSFKQVLLILFLQLEEDLTIYVFGEINCCAFPSNYPGVTGEKKKQIIKQPLEPTALRDFRESLRDMCAHTYLYLLTEKGTVYSFGAKNISSFVENDHVRIT